MPAVGRPPFPVGRAIARTCIGPAFKRRLLGRFQVFSFSGGEGSYSGQRVECRKADAVHPDSAGELWPLFLAEVLCDDAYMIEHAEARPGPRATPVTLFSAKT